MVPSVASRIKTLDVGISLFWSEFEGWAVDTKQSPIYNIHQE